MRRPDDVDDVRWERLASLQARQRAEPAAQPAVEPAVGPAAQSAVSPVLPGDGCGPPPGWFDHVGDLVAGLAREDLAVVPTGAMGEDALRLLAAAEALRAEAVRRLGAFDAGRGWQGSGSRSLGSWIAHRASLAGGEARSLAATARLAQRHDEVADALRAGALPLAAARQVAAAVTPERAELFADAPEALVGAVCTVQLRDVPRVVGWWRSLADDVLATEESGEDHDRRWASASVLPGGRVRFDGELDAVGGAALLAGLDDLMAPDPADVADGPRPAPQRRADAFAELARRYLAGRRAEVGPQAPGVGVDVHLGLADLLAGLGRTCTCGGAGGGPGGAGRLGAEDPCAAACTCGAGASTRPGASDGGLGGAAGTGVGPSAGGQHPPTCRAADACTCTGPVASATDPALDPLSGISEVGRLGPVARVVAARLACDADLGRIVDVPDAATVAHLLGPDGPLAALRDTPLGRRLLEAPSQPLDVGRRQRLFTPAQRRAIAARDGSCRFPGCDRPPEWCDVHHLDPWEAGGPTDLANGLLLCAHHHTVVHLRRWRPQRGPDGRWTVAPPGAGAGRGPDAPPGAPRGHARRRAGP